jgi:hypothetical protein
MQQMGNKEYDANMQCRYARHAVTEEGGKGGQFVAPPEVINSRARNGAKPQASTFYSPNRLCLQSRTRANGLYVGPLEP